MSVGMAIAERWLAATFNRPGFTIVDYNVYAMGGDGCMMEGVAPRPLPSPATSGSPISAGSTTATGSRSKGSTDLAFSEDVGARFSAYGWSVTRVSDANDLHMLTRA